MLDRLVDVRILLPALFVLGLAVIAFGWMAFIHRRVKVTRKRALAGDGATCLGCAAMLFGASVLFIGLLECLAWALAYKAE